MTSEDHKDESKEVPQPVFHGAPTRPEPPATKDARLNKTLAAGIAVGIGSAALVAALLYARSVKSKPKPTSTPEPSD